MRLVMDGQKVYGGQSTYGLDWVLGHPTNQWQKRTIVRVITIAQPGMHTFMLQIRAQGNGNRLYIHPGNVGEEYSGLHMYLFKLGLPPPSMNAAACKQPLGYCYFHSGAGFSISTTAWTRYSVRHDLV